MTVTPPPRVGETVYYDTGGREPRVVVAVSGTLVTTVPARSDIRSTHQGNLYDANGKEPWRVF